MSTEQWIATHDEPDFAAYLADKFWHAIDRGLPIPQADYVNWLLEYRPSV